MVESDTTGDGLKDYRMEFKYGVFEKAIFFNYGNRMPLKIQNYANNKLVSAKVDTSGDGILDTAYTYDELKEIATKHGILD